MYTVGSISGGSKTPFCCKLPLWFLRHSMSVSDSKLFEKTSSSLCILPSGIVLGTWYVLSK